MDFSEFRNRFSMKKLSIPRRKEYIDCMKTKREPTNIAWNNSSMITPSHASSDIQIESELITTTHLHLCKG